MFTAWFIWKMNGHCNWSATYFKTKNRKVFANQFKFFILNHIPSSRSRHWVGEAKNFKYTWLSSVSIILLPILTGKGVHDVLLPCPDCYPCYPFYLLYKFCPLHLIHTLLSLIQRDEAIKWNDRFHSSRVCFHCKLQSGAPMPAVEKAEWFT